MKDIFLDKEIGKLLDICSDRTTEVYKGCIKRNPFAEDFNSNINQYDTEIFRWIFTQATAIPLLKREIKTDKFIKIKDCNISLIQQEIKANERLFLFDTSRQDNTKVQKETNSILLKGGSRVEGININFLHDVEETILYKKFPIITSFLEDFCEKEGEGYLQRAMIVKLLPNSKVYEHYDYGDYYLLRDRYHLVVQTDGSLMKVKDEYSTWQNGELWWFNNKLIHEAFNESNNPRIHIIFDVLPKRNLMLTKQIRSAFYQKSNVCQTIIDNYKYV